MWDIEQMYDTFHVHPKHQNFLRFLWFKDNEPSKEIVEYKMTVHPFDNVPSPAIATFGLRKTADEGEKKYGKAAREFVHGTFSVDHGLSSCPTENETVDLLRLKRRPSYLCYLKYQLHKAVPQSLTVMEI